MTEGTGRSGRRPANLIALAAAGIATLVALAPVADAADPACGEAPSCDATSTAPEPAASALKDLAKTLSVSAPSETDSLRRARALNREGVRLADAQEHLAALRKFRAAARLAPGDRLYQANVALMESIMASNYAGNDKLALAKARLAASLSDLAIYKRWLRGLEQSEAALRKSDGQSDTLRKIRADVEAANRALRRDGRTQASPADRAPADPAPLDPGEPPSLDPAAISAMASAAARGAAPERRAGQAATQVAQPDKGAPRGEPTSWRLQFATMRSAAGAERIAATLRGSHSALTKPLEISVRAQGEEEAKRFRVLSQPLSDRGAALSLCKSFRAEQVDCVVVVAARAPAAEPATTVSAAAD